ncbi:uncharacterized protein LOC132638813 isoform X3 [Lycium barbarum]|uniref:uncharacterized protein LOC132638813 isoform X3 n=1 Tax=Lycium barbarum TaxID=112863 RepID=UPI00293E3A94|nr:uncharacterized protein LOC132638813 isoform X3 [Lycium barbarum]
MAQKLGIHVITPDTADWTCKIQVVDICGPGESNVKKIKYLNMIVQDEQEDQIKAIVYGDDIPIYQNILAIVVNCSPPRYVASVEKRLQELIVIDTLNQSFKFTIWEEPLIENEGSKLLRQFQEYPIILARRIGASKFEGFYDKMEL